MRVDVGPQRARLAADLPAYPQRRGRRDRRLALGLVLLAAAAALGAFLLDDHDARVTVLVMRHDLPAGAQVRRVDVRPRQLRVEADVAGRYADPARLAQGLALDRPVRSGDLLPASALRPAPVTPQIEVPLGVRRDDLPATVTRGSIVDVWLLPRAGDGRARRLLSGVRVAQVAAGGHDLDPAGTRQVVVCIADAGRSALARSLSLTAGRRVLVTRRR